jgi:hypothetical protein
MRIKAEVERQLAGAGRLQVPDNRPEGRALLQLACDLPKRREIRKRKGAVIAIDVDRLEEAALFEIAKVIQPQHRIHRQDVAMTVTLTGLLVIIGSDNCCLAAGRRVFRRIEWQVRHADQD